MPYRGQTFRNPKALRGATDYWAAIDPTVNQHTSQTFTADIERYVAALSALVFQCDSMEPSALGHVSTMADGKNCAAPLRVITIRGGNHVWPGHTASGPQSGQPQNMDFDATSKIADFFGITK
jgi:poly(3-hydroxybutyrate) depolymerase